jgi:hypothetical protein
MEIMDSSGTNGVSLIASSKIYTNALEQAFWFEIMTFFQNFRNPYRKVLPTPAQKNIKKREKKKLPRGPYLSKMKNEL